MYVYMPHAIKIIETKQNRNQNRSSYELISKFFFLIFFFLIMHMYFKLNYLCNLLGFLRQLRSYLQFLSRQSL